jgi:hypothetical protein
LKKSDGNTLVVLGHGKTIGEFSFVIGEVQVGKFIEPSALKVVYGCNSQDEAEKILAAKYPDYSRLNGLSSLSSEIISIWSV